GLVGTCYSDTLISKTQSSLTTPDGITLSKLIHEAVSGGAKALITEVSSHALDQKRLYGHKFNTVIFTNLTHDHLDYHKNIESYKAAKQRLFTSEYISSSSYAVINLDDPWAQDLIKDIPCSVITYSLKDK